MRIALILETSGGGSGRHVLDLARGLVAAGHEVAVVYSRLRAEPRFLEALAEIPGLSRAAIDMRRAPHAGDLVAVWRLRRFLAAQGPFDVIHGHSSKAGAIARLAALGLPGVRLYTPHCFRTMDPELGRVGRLVYGGIERVLARLGHGLIAVSPEELEHAAGLGIPRAACALVLNGVAPADLSQRAALRAAWGLGPEEVSVGFLSRFVPQKAPERAIAGLRALPTGLPAHRLVMVGEGPLEAELRAAAAGLSPPVVFAPGSLGPAAMAAFDIFILPSAYEGMPYVLAEAAAAGLPIVATDVGGARAVISPEVNGLIVPNFDVAVFADALARLIADRDLRARMAAASRAAAARLTIPAMVAATTAIYDRARAGFAPGQSALRQEETPSC